MCKIEMIENSLKFGYVIVNKKEFHNSKQAIALIVVETDKIKISDRFRRSDNGSKDFIGYKNTLLATKKMISLDLYILHCLK